MKRLQIQVLAFTLAVLAAGAACARSNSGCPGLIAPTGPAYTISGVVTAYRGGPVPGATVWVYPSFASPLEGNCGGTPDAHIDQQGRYTWTGPFSTISVAVAGDGYHAAYKNNLLPRELTANFVLHPYVAIKPGGDTLAGTVRGDEFITGDDVLFGGLCARTPCKIGEFDLRGAGFLYPPIKRVEVRLRWNDPGRQLALYVSHVGNLEDPPFSSGTTVERVCCAPELVGTADVGKYFPDAVAVAFERGSGGMPGPAESVEFELTARSAP